MKLKIISYLISMVLVLGLFFYIISGAWKHTSTREEHILVTPTIQPFTIDKEKPITSHQKKVKSQKSKKSKKKVKKEKPKVIKETKRTYFSILHGKLLDANPNGGVDGNTLVIKAKIEPSFTNKLTIHLNYFNVEDIIKKQGGDKFNAIDYWAVADMQDGSEAKVISFLVEKELIELIKNEGIAPIEYGDYVSDLWILPSLKE